jgi:CubicO group peptidase (beta-lactamase class C family)
LIALLLSGAVGALAAAWPTNDWEVSMPEAQGMDSRLLMRFYQQVAKPAYRTDSVLIVRNGYIVSEAYFAPYEKDLLHDLRSVTKSILGTVVGVAIQQGRIHGRHQQVLDFFPGHEASDPRQKLITIEHLLQMRSGIQWQEWPYDERSDVLKMAASSDWVRYILRRPMNAGPGVHFQYIGAAPHLLSAILTRATGQQAAEFARDQLFRSLGISDVKWLSDPRGNSVGESGISMRPRDLAKIGYLYLHDGRWDGAQLLPGDWVRHVFAGSSPHTVPLRRGLPPRYGTLWWVDERPLMAAAIGRHGQYLVVLPRQAMILVITAKTSDFTEQPLNITDLVSTYLLPAAVSARPLPANPGATAQLRAALAQLSAGSALPGRAATGLARCVSGRVYRFERNALNLAELSIEFAPDHRSSFVMGWNTGLFSPAARFERPFGSDGRYLKSSTTPFGIFASRGAWQDANTLLIQSESLQSSTSTDLLMRFQGNEVELTAVESEGTKKTARGVGRGYPPCPRRSARHGRTRRKVVSSNSPSASCTSVASPHSPTNVGSCKSHAT